MPGVRFPMISKETRDAKGFQHGLELEKYLVLAAAKHLRQDLPCPVLNGMPQPAGLSLAADIAPPFVSLRSPHSGDTPFHVP